MKKALSFVLVLVLSLSVFAGVTVFADDDPFEWDHYLVFGKNGYGYNKPAEEISVYFKNTEWEWAFEEIKAHLEYDGEPVTGLIEANKNYDLVIELKIYELTDSKYGFSTLDKENVKLYSKEASSPSAKEYYFDGEYCVARYELVEINPTYTSFEFIQEGYALGASAGSISVISNTEGIEMYQPMVTVYDEATGRNKNYYGELEQNVEYGLMVTFFVPDGYDVDPMAEVSLFGFGDKPIAPDSVVSQWAGWINGRDMYACHFVLPVLEEEQVAGDVDGDGEVTVADALSVLRVAAKLAQPTKSTGSAFDFDGDGEVTVNDALCILRIAAKLA